MIVQNEFDVPTLLARAQDGNDEAALAIWNAYYDRMVRYAKTKLQSMPRRAVDEEDVALSAMNSFFSGASRGQLAPKDQSELWKLLATITVRKANAQLRKHYAAKRGGGNVRGESAFAMADTSGGDGIDAAPEGSIASFSPFLSIACEETLAELDDPQLQQIAMLRLANHTNDEIAEKLGCSLATVKRKVAQIRERWSGLE